MTPHTILSLGVRIPGLVFLYRGLMAAPRFVVPILSPLSNFQLKILNRLKVSRIRPQA